MVTVPRLFPSLERLAVSFIMLWLLRLLLLWLPMQLLMRMIDRSAQHRRNVRRRRVQRRFVCRGRQDGGSETTTMAKVSDESNNMARAW